MKNNKYNFIIIYLLFSWLMISTGYAQTNKKERQSKQTLVELNSKVVDEKGSPVKDASIITGESAVILFTDAKGEFKTKVPSNATIIIEAFGYTTQLYQLAQKVLPKEVVLKKEAIFSSEDFMLNRADGSRVSQRNLVGAVGTIKGKDLMSYPDLVVTNSLQGKAAGLIIRNNVSGLGNNTPSVFLRGQHTNGNSQALIIIDGIERPLEDLLPEEIEKIELLKDATSKVLYGPRAANGVLMVTTRRGENNRRALKITAEAGLNQVTRLPQYLNSYEYAGLYNEARTNDGLVPFYNQLQLEGYQNSQGANDLLYPNVDNYKEFIKPQTSYKKAVLEMNGGNNSVKYAVIAGFTGADGIENSATATLLNRFNLRANLDVKVTDYLSLVAGVSGRMEIRSWGAMDGSQLFTALSTHRPNEYPFTITPEDIGIPADSSGLPHFGAGSRQTSNLYANMMYGGKTAERYANNQSNLGLNFKLDRITKGLTAGAFITFDNYDYYKESQIPVNATYDVSTYNNANGVLDTLYTQMLKYAPVTRKSRVNAETSRSLGLRANIGYENHFGIHSVSSMLGYNYAKYEVKGTAQDVINATYTAHLNYDYNNKYIVEFNAALMGSNRFAPGNKFFLSPAIGAAWIISNEDFMPHSGNVNFLKLKASYGVLGYDRNTDYLMYQRAWADNGIISFGEANNGNKPRVTSMVRAASPNLKWEQSAELNIGVEGLFMNNRLRSELNYFNENRTNIIGFQSESYGDYLGSYVYNTNMGSVTNKGIEGYVSWSDKIGDFGYTFGANFIWSKNKLATWNDVVPDQETYRSPIGKPTDAMFGLVSQGLFGKDVALSGHPFQTFGPYQEGDLAYEDLNSDNIIDGRDQRLLGNSFPRTSFGIDLTLNFRGWGMYVLGAGETGVNKWANNNYYWNRAEDKYSITALNRYHPVNNPDGTYPRLTTTSGENNFRNSTMWLLNTDFLRIKNLEFSYTFTDRSFTAVAKQIKFFARGTNLFVLSSIKDLDPELLNGGVTNYPLMRAFTGGVSFTF